MAKTKINQGISKVLFKQKQSLGVKTSNPFEIQTKKSKFSILNRDKWQDGQFCAPGIHRAQAIEKRKKTISNDFLMKNKSNRFVDHRKQGQPLSSRRKQLYCLNDSIKLTHRGHTLEEIEHLDEPVDNDDMSDEEGGQLNDEFVEAVNFGGGEHDDRSKDRKTAIEEIIAESKRRKVEKQRENDEVYQLTQKLDQSWHGLISVVGGFAKSSTERPKLEDYDRVMREMIFERRGKPADKLKSEAELALIERQKLEKLEREKLLRMKVTENNLAPKHRSADDLDDDYSFLSIANQNNDTISNTDTQGIEGCNDPHILIFEDEDRNMLNEFEKVNNEESSSEFQNEDSSGSGSEGDSFLDMKEDLKNIVETVKIVKSKKPSNLQQIDNNSDSSVSKIVTSQDKMGDIPLTFELPQKYEEFFKLLHCRTAYEHTIILKRMLNSNSYIYKSKPKTMSLFAFVIQYINDLFHDSQLESISSCFEIVEHFTPHVYDLMQHHPAETAQLFLDVLKEKQEEFRKRPRQYPSLETMIFIKLIPVLFSESDFRHPVVSPALVFASEILARCLICSRRDVTLGLFLITTVLECVEQTKRMLPAAINFLNGVIYMCSPKRIVETIAIIPPFKSSAPWNSLLAIDEKSDVGIELQLRSEDFLLDYIDEEFKLRALYCSLRMINDICKNQIGLPGSPYISENFLLNLNRIDILSLPTQIDTVLKETVALAKSLKAKSLMRLVAPEQKPKQLRLLEPKIERIYDDIRRRSLPKPTIKEQHKKLQKKVKQEARAATREIRQDNEFIAKLQFRLRETSDRKRREKVKRIFSDATLQQGELNSFDRKLKYKK
ncbi:nucleolar protein 14 homolog [Sabethes cyaneus]|uniref:nucleolar protein 14 homolog n=1 Tax=Sabethes cyaneus TaxID=53552 RepID=UPI00237EE4B5|nr:nucleolar protein 14 homolog [Sabethes cyaneus]